MGQRRSVSRRVERAMDLPGGTLCKTALLELEGNRRLVITGCRGILSYTEDCICMRTPDGTVTIYGSDLELGCLSEDGATVVGTVQRIEFAGEG